MSSPELTEAAQQLAGCWSRFERILADCRRALAEGDWVLLNDEAGE